MICNVISYLQSVAFRFPKRIGVADSNTAFTYEQLWDRVSRMGTSIQERLHMVNRPIAVLIKHDASDVVAFYSIVYSGNFYVPVDMSLPPERTAKMFEIIQPAAVIGSDADAAVPIEGLEVWTPELLLGEQTQIASPWKACKDTDLLYVIFTSGSTGEPKGVAVSHRSVVDMVEHFMEAFDFADGSVFGNQAPFDFDVSVKDMYLAVRVGGTLEILEKKLFSVPKHLINRLNERKVDTLIWAVPAYNILAQLRAFRQIMPSFLKNCMFSGEIMPIKTLRYWMDALPDVRFVNLYGPTEITCNCTYYVVEDANALVDAVPIGIPFGNCSVFLLDGDQLVQEEGQIGELCVAGTCLAMGYYHRLDLTQAAFPQNPLNQAYLERIYRTGDLGCYQNGVLVFKGRKDSQIKHMGHRIELAEVIQCANSMECVDSSACIYDSENRKIALFYRGDVSDQELYAYLAQRLPRYMLPGIMKQLETFPKTRTGKIDNKVLMQMLRGD